MSLQETPDDEQTGEGCAMSASGNKSLPRAKEEMQEPSTAVIQMTIQPQSTTPAEFPVSLVEPLAVALAEPLAVVLAELPQALLDIVPSQEPQVESAGSSAFEYVAEVEEPPLPRYEAPGLPSGLPPRPAFSYRSDAAQGQLCPPAAHPAAHSADTYDYTDEGEFALERALATALGQAGAGAVPVAEVEAPSPPPLDEPLDAAALYHELERGFDLARYEGIQLQLDPPSVEYSENGAILQSELFELGQGGFVPQELSVCDVLGVEPELPSTLSPLADRPAPLADLEEVPASELHMVAPADLQMPASASIGEDQPLTPPVEQLDSPAPLEDLQLAPPEEQSGPSRPRAHAVQIYPGEGEGEPQTCYITNLPRLAIEATFYEDGARDEAMPLQPRPLTGGARPADMLRQLLGVPGDEEGEVPASPASSEDSAERDKENKPDTVAAALRSAALSFAAEDLRSQTTNNNAEEPERDLLDLSTEANLSEAMEHLSVSQPELDTPKAEETETVAAPVSVGQVKVESKVKNAEAKVTASTIVTEPALGSCQAEDRTISVDQPKIEDVSPVVLSENVPPTLPPPSTGPVPAEKNKETTVPKPAAAAAKAGSTATGATAGMASPKKRKLPPATTAIKTKKAKKLLSSNKAAATAAATAESKLKLAKPKRKCPAKQPTALKTRSIPLKAKTARKAVDKGSSAAIVPIESASESTVSSEDSNDSKTLAVIIAERNAVIARSAQAVAGAPGVPAAAERPGAHDASAAGAAAGPSASADPTAAAAAPGIVQAQPVHSEKAIEKAKGKRGASGQFSQTKQKQAKKARAAPEMPTTTMVLRSRSHLM